MKKMLMIALCVGLVPMLFAAQEDAIQKTGFFFESGARIRIISETEFEAMVALQTEDSLYYYTSDPTLNGIGFGSATTWEGAIRFTPTELAPYVGDEITAVWWYHYDGSSPNGRVIIYDNNIPTLPGPVLQQDPYTGAVTGWVRCDLSSNVTISGAGDLWASIEVQDPGGGFFPIGIDAGPAIDGKGDWVYEASLGWAELQSYGLDYNWSLIAIVVSGGVTSHDVGTSAILAPGAIEMPNTTLNPQATYRNYGDFTETFDVYFEIDSLGFNVYSQTANITRDPGADTTITWPSWTTGPIDGIVYDVTAYTVLAGDENPINDTVAMTTTTTSTFWESFANMPAARSGPFAGWYLDPSGVLTVHVFGGNPGPASTHYIWDHASNSWSTGTALPAAANYGGHVTVGERIYMVGARQAPGEGLITIYDTPSDVYTTTSLPGGTIGDPACAVKDNNLIYIVGGCRPGGWIATTIVNLYDIAADTFYTAVTQLPGSTARTCAAAAIIGDTIYVAGGIDGGGSYTNQFVVGYIDPANPANITWGTGIDKPGSAVYRLNGGPVFDDAGNGVFYIAGGDPFTAETYAYTPGSGWTTCSNKITAVSNWGRAIAPSPISDDAEWIMYAAGGYSPYQNVLEGYHTGTITGIKEMPNEQINAFSFKVTSPNPISNRASFAFSMPHRGEVTFNIYDVSGRNVLDSYYSNISQGEHTLFWDLKDNAHRDVASGIYLYRMETGTYHAEGKLVVVR